MLENALIYRRVSTEEQAAEERHSLNTQLRLCTKAIEESGKHKLAPDPTYTDPGRSGTNMNRAALQDMLARVTEDKSIKAIYVQDTDRLARNANDHLTIKALLKKHGVVIISVSQPGIEDSPEGNFLDLMLAGTNQLSSQITGRKTKKSMEERFWNGWFPTRAPLGYLNSIDPLNPKKKIIIIDPIRGPLVREMLTLYSKGVHSILEVREIMYKKGLVNRSGNRFTRGQVADVINNPFYYGEMRLRGMVNMGKHEPLITKAIFDKCNRVKADHNGNRCRKRKHNFLLRGFVYCASCNKRWTAEKNIKKNKSYYRCNAQAYDVWCKERYIETSDLEKQVEDKFAAIEFSPEFTEKVVERVKSLYQEKKDLIIADQKQLTHTKTNLVKKLEIAEEKLLSGVLSDDAFKRIQAKTRPQIESLEQELTKLDKVRQIKVEVIRKILDLTRNLAQTYKNAPIELKRRYIGLFWTKFEVSGGKIVNAIPSEMIEMLIGIGAVSIHGKLKSIPVESMFVLKGAYLNEGVQIKTERGA